MTREEQIAAVETSQLVRGLADFSGPVAAFWQNCAEAMQQSLGAETVTIFWRVPAEGIWRDLAAAPDSARMIAIETVTTPAVMAQALREGVAQGGDGRHMVAPLHVLETGQEVILLARFAVAPRNIASVMNKLAALSAVPLTYDALRKLRIAGRDAARLALTLDLMGKVLDSDTFDRAALSFANGLAEQFACESVALVWQAREGLRLRAMSHSEKIAQRTEASVLIEDCGQEAVTQGTEITWPSTDRAVAHAHGQYAQLMHPGHMLSLPMIETLPDGKTRPLGAVVLARQSRPFTAAEQWALRLHCEMMQHPLSWFYHDTRWLHVRLGRAILPSIPKVFRPRTGAGRRLLASAAVILVAVMLIPIPFVISGTAVLKTDATAFVGAPFDGYIESSVIILGDVVAAGQPLFVLAKTELVLERNTLLAELAQSNREAEIRRSMNQLTEMQVAQSKADEVKTRLFQVDQRLASATALAPIAGVVVDGEPAKKIGEAVRRGEAIVTVAALSSVYVEAVVSQRDLSFLRPGQATRLTLLARPQDAFGMTVERIIPAAQVQDADNVFPVRMAMSQDGTAKADWWLPGMTGVAKISVGYRPIGWIATRRIADYLRLLFWY